MGYETKEMIVSGSQAYVRPDFRPNFVVMNAEFTIFNVISLSEKEPRIIVGDKVMLGTKSSNEKSKLGWGGTLCKRINNGNETRGGELGSELLKIVISSFTRTALPVNFPFRAIFGEEMSSEPLWTVNLI